MLRRLLILSLGLVCACAMRGKPAPRCDMGAPQVEPVYAAAAPGNAIAFSPDGRLLATGSMGRSAVLWEAATARPLRHLRGHTDAVFALAFAPDGRRLISGSRDRTTALWDVRTGARLIRSAPMVASPRAVAFSPDGRRTVACAMFHGLYRDDPAGAELLVQDARTGAEVRRITIDQERQGWTRCEAVAFSADGRFVLADNVRWSWHVDTGEATPFAPGARPPVREPDELALRIARDLGAESSWVSARSPDGAHMAIVEEYLFGGELSLVEIPSGRLIASHDDLPAFMVPDALPAPRSTSPDGRFVAVHAEDVTRIADVATGSPLLEVVRWDDGAWVARTPDGRFDGSNPEAHGDPAFLSGRRAGQYPADASELVLRVHEPGLVLRALGVEPRQGAEVPDLRWIGLRVASTCGD